MTPKEIKELRAEVDALRDKADALWTAAEEARKTAQLATAEHAIAQQAAIVKMQGGGS